MTSASHSLSVGIDDSVNLYAKEIKDVKDHDDVLSALLIC